MSGTNYGPLRAATQEAILNAIEAPPEKQPQIEAREPEPEPVRPEGHYGPSLGWTAEGGMAQQQASANRWFQASQERQAQRVEAGRESGGDDQRSVGEPADRAEQVQPAARTLTFFEDRERAGQEKSDQDRTRDSAEPAQEKAPGEGRTLTFFEDRYPGLSHGHER